MLSAAPELAPKMRMATRSAGNPATYFVGEDNENNAGTGSPDGDMDEFMSYKDASHPIEANLFISEGTLPQKSAYLAVRTFDVDWEDGEYDRLYINGRFVAPLTGLSSQWNTSFYSIPISYLWEGNNTVKVDIGDINMNDVAEFGEEKPVSYQSGGWVVVIDWMQLVCDGGSKQGINEYSIKLSESRLSGNSVIISAQTVISSEDPNVKYVTEYSITNQRGFIVGSYQGSGVSGSESFSISMPQIQRAAFTPCRPC